MMRVGIGYDVHRFEAGRPLMLGGVLLPSDIGLQGHSDADVLIHSIIDAMLGAVALGDIGRHFPDTDERWRGADSRDLLRHTRSLLENAGYSVVNVDVSVSMESPRIASHVEAMRVAIASCLGIDTAFVSVKATTGEGMGFVGRREGVAAWAVCAVESKS